MLEERVVEFGGVTVKVRQANLIAGFKRARMQRELINEPGLDKSDPDRANVRWFYCDLVAGTVDVDGMDWPMNVETFENQSDQWFDQVGWPWLQTVRSVNPNWDLSASPEQGESTAAAG